MNSIEEEQIAFIGLGQMGAGMATSLVKNSVPLWVLDLDTNRVTLLEQHGAINANNIETIQAKCGTLFICLPNEEDVHTLLFAEHGLLNSPSHIHTIIDTSTINYCSAQSYAKDARARGINYCDCPVSGLPKRSWDGTLTMMFGGPVEIFETVKPYLNLMGKDILHCGDVGKGQLTKAVNNIIYNINIAGFCEVLPLAVKAGLDPTLLETLILGGSSRSLPVSISFPV